MPHVHAAGRVIQPNDRALVLGSSTSGKSELINHLFEGFRVQRLMVDTKGSPGRPEFIVPGVESVSEVSAIDWREPIVHYVTRGDDEAREVGELFAAVNARHQQAHRRLMVAVHELADLCEYQPNRTHPQTRALFNKGAAIGIGVIGGTQRPVYVPLHSRTEALHTFHMVPRLTDDDDHRACASSMGLKPPELAGLLADLEAEHGPYSFLWFDRRARAVRPCPPLAEHLRPSTRRGTIIG